MAPLHRRREETLRQLAQGNRVQPKEKNRGDGLERRPPAGTAARSAADGPSPPASTGRREGNAGVHTGTAPRSGAKLHNSQVEKSRGRLGTPTSGRHRGRAQPTEKNRGDERRPPVAPRKLRIAAPREVRPEERISTAASSSPSGFGIAARNLGLPGCGRKRQKRRLAASLIEAGLWPLGHDSHVVRRQHAERQVAALAAAPPGIARGAALTLAWRSVIGAGFALPRVPTGGRRSLACAPSGRSASRCGTS